MKLAPVYSPFQSAISPFSRHWSRNSAFCFCQKISGIYLSISKLTNYPVLTHELFLQIIVKIEMDMWPTFNMGFHKITCWIFDLNLNDVKRPIACSIYQTSLWLSVKRLKKGFRFYWYKKEHNTLFSAGLFFLLTFKSCYSSPLLLMFIAEIFRISHGLFLKRVAKNFEKKFLPEEKIIFLAHDWPSGMTSFLYDP